MTCLGLLYNGFQWVVLRLLPTAMKVVGCTCTKLDDDVLTGFSSIVMLLACKGENTVCMIEK